MNIPTRHIAAFTLIELLTVIAIIGILAAILIPTVGKVRETARQTVCTSRMKELGTAFALYAQDHRDCLPDPDDEADKRWPHYMMPYIGSWKNTYDANGRVSGLESGDPYRLPLFRDPVQESMWMPAGVGHGIFGYNTNLNHTYPDATLKNATPVRYGSLSQPSRFIVLATTEAIKVSRGGGIQLETSVPSPMAVGKGYTGGTTSDRGIAPLFGRKAVILFADWHVAAPDVCTANAWPWNDVQAFDPAK
ncbi:MAG: prepilin-type N-terminal cleavage/methylation domain-containing protein [Opitutaceae bacterium]|jgi:prepilin-type N-terminal cleavage/methylation domain-containing protein/prepilin-type processing-associated H-X9-DG protein|nr:prepilin-type N-terminal cleavage/methylation domain-containing protein [Opitutaceae bacterium]